LISRQTIKYAIGPDAAIFCDSADVIYPLHRPGDAATDLRWFSVRYSEQHPDHDDRGRIASPARVVCSRGVYAFHTGLRVELPDWCCGIIKTRSGTGLLPGTLRTYSDVTVRKGVIDPGFRGEIVVMLSVSPDSVHPISFYRGGRIAQLVLLPYVAPLWAHSEISEMDVSPRGELGFGSTGDD